MRTAKFRILVLATLPFLSSCMVSKAVDYSFNVADHGDYEFNGQCFGIDDEPGERLLITDCGGYRNLLTSTLTLGLSRSSQEVSNIYRTATEDYLISKYTNCEIAEVIDHGGKIFEIHYSC